jgi:ParB-like chromosome segregation protein Spo0J
MSNNNVNKLESDTSQQEERVVDDATFHEASIATDERSLPVVSDAPPISTEAAKDEVPTGQVCNEFPISEIKIGNRCRRDLGDIDELARSIAEVGLLHPAVVRPDGSLIAGWRRVAACKKLGWKTVPVHVVNLEQIVRGEFAENAFRKRFLPTENYAIWQALEPIERVAAQERQKATRFGDGAGKLPAPGKGRTRDRIAKFAGVSGRTLDKIAEVMKAAEADPQYEPLLKMMDHAQCVDGAFRQLQAMRAAAKAGDNTCSPSSETASAHKISVAAWNAKFPQYPMIVEDKGWIYGVWYCGTSWQKARLHGEYPPTLLDRALALFPDAKKIVHCPSGTVLGPGVTIDLIRDDIRCPQIVADAAQLPLPSGSADTMLSDPPYTDADSAIYGCAPFPLKAFMDEAHRVLCRGGYLGILHLYIPPYRATDWKLVATIAVLTGFCRATRMFSIFERL